MIMRDIIKPTLVITAVALVCVLGLSHVQRLAGPEIIKRVRESQAAALSLVLPGYNVGEARTAVIDGTAFTYWVGEKKEDDKTVPGYAFVARSPGYGGDIESMVGVDDTGVILGMSIINQSETPGLGSRCAEVADRETLWDYLRGGIPRRDLADGARIPWFQNQFKGLNASGKIGVLRRGVWNPGMRAELLEKNAISALTGATITSTAVITGIEKGVALLAKARQREVKKAAEAR
jgi:Na+-translocating ferredoxin:NAD+ oxidoreductase subunit G